MSFRTGRRMNDGNMSGMRQDRFRNTEFEHENWRDDDRYSHQGVTRATPNTLGVGRFNENRGRRGDSDWANPRTDNPFENGDLANWNYRQGWDEHFDRSFDRGNRSHGGALVGHDAGGQHRGKGPRGYSRPDNRIYEDVCDRLSMSAGVDASDIEVSVKDGCVFLNGFVPDRDMKKMAELEIENISGVIDVQNLLSIRRSEGSGQQTDKRDQGPRAALS